MRQLIQKRADAFHPGSWWLLGLSLAIAAGATGSIAVALAICVFSLTVARLMRTQAPWAKSLCFYLGLATVIVFIRVAFRVLFNQPTQDATAFTLPDLQLNLGFGGAIHLLGPVSWVTLNAALLDGTRLAAIVLSVALANTLANPRRILKSTPGALYEVTTAISVAINLAPQLIDSLQRVRRARKLRGQSRRVGALAGTIIPVLEDTMERSMSLAASMDARGFGRRGNSSRAQLTATRLISLASIGLFATGAYLLLTDSLQTTMAVATLACGFVALLIVVRQASRLHVRTRFRRQSMNGLDAAVWGLALVILALALTRFGGAL